MRAFEAVPSVIEGTLLRREEELGAIIGAAGSSTCFPSEAILVVSLLAEASREEVLTRDDGTDLDCRVTGLTLRH